MPEGSKGAEAVFLQPGEMFATDAPRQIKTIVGSCVAITIRAPRVGVAAIAHCMLPQAAAAGEPLTSGAEARYVDTAIDGMLRIFARQGVALAELEIKVFGGADAIGSGYGVGRRNVDAALTVLAARGLRLAATAVGGKEGRVLQFDTETGEVLLKTLPQRTSPAEELPL